MDWGTELWDGNNAFCRTVRAGKVSPLVRTSERVEKRWNAGSSYPLVFAERCIHEH